MPCCVTTAEKYFYTMKYSDDELKKLNLNTDGTDADFLISILCSHLHFIKKNLSYTEFKKIVQPHLIEWFDQHCLNDLERGEKL